MIRLKGLLQSYRLRSFTAAGVEVVGIGHNALGAWLWLASGAELGPLEQEVTVHQEIGDRLLPVRIRRVPHHIEITMQQAPLRRIGEVADRDALANALGLIAADLTVPPVVISTGAPHALVGVRDRAALDRVHPTAECLARCLRESGAEGCYVFSLAAPDEEVRAHARFFNPGAGLWEDAATGSAAGPLAGYLLERGWAQPDADIVIEQGRRMGRPSRLSLRVEGEVVSITGSGVTVAEGWLAF